MASDQQSLHARRVIEREDREREEQEGEGVREGYVCVREQTRERNCVRESEREGERKRGRTQLCVVCDKERAIDLRVQMHTHIHTCMYPQMYASIHGCMYAYMFVFVCGYMQMFLYTQVSCV